VAKAPVAAAAAGKKLRAFKAKFDRIGNALMPAARPAGQPAASGPAFGTPDDASAPPPTVVQVSQAPPPPDYGPFLSRAFGTTTEIISGTITMLLLLFFLLAGGRTWRDRVVNAAPSPAAAQQTVDIIREIQEAMSRYFYGAFLINLAQGVLVAGAMWVVDIPSPVLWGILTFFAEFIPYAGGFVMVLLLTLVGLSVADTAQHAIVAPALFLLITTVQNSLVSPLVHGRGLRLHPVPIIIAVVSGWLLWGIPGAFLAVPLLAGLSIICRRVEGLGGLGTFLAD
jgi:predicted PurR-regulated permease PerM